MSSVETVSVLRQLLRRVSKRNSHSAESMKGLSTFILDEYRKNRSAGPAEAEGLTKNAAMYVTHLEALDRHVFLLKDIGHLDDKLDLDRERVKKSAQTVGLAVPENYHDDVSTKASV